MPNLGQNPFFGGLGNFMDSLISGKLFLDMSQKATDINCTMYLKVLATFFKHLIYKLDF